MNDSILVVLIFVLWCFPKPIGEVARATFDNFMVGWESK